MYNFIDITEASGKALLPSEALRINGEYIEDIIPGYRTLYVKGREALSPELDFYETGIRDGSTLKKKRYPARYITVGYQLSAATSEEFREAYNTLGDILNVEDAELIFEDETDKYYTGTFSAISEVEPGRNTVKGEFEFFCADPFKYSVVEYEAESFIDDKSILIDYNGTYKSFPILEADFYKEAEVAEDDTETALTGNGDCGFVAFFNENEQIIQLGNPDEKDAAEDSSIPKSQTLISQLFSKSSSWGTNSKKPWALNAGNLIPSSVQQLGDLAMKIAKYEVQATPTTTTGTLFTGWSDSSSPKFYYKVTAKAYSRTANSIKLNVSITASLQYSGSYFGRGYGLKAHIYAGGIWHEVRLKSTSSYWRGRTGHTVSMTLTVSGLTDTATVLSGLKFKVTRTDSVGGSAGKLAEHSCKSLSISPYVEQSPSEYFLASSSYGTASGKYHGPSITRTIKADSVGEVGATDFSLTYKQRFCVSKVSQIGAFQMQVTSDTGSNVCGVRILKSASGNSGYIYFYVNGKNVGKTSIDLSLKNKYFGLTAKAIGASTVIKSGNKITFTIGGIKKEYRDDSIKDAKALKVTFAFEQYSGSAAVAYNGISSVKFVKNKCSAWRDIPNKFSANDIVEADCKDGKIYLNGVESPEYGALGNDWEGMYLTKGLNQIGVAYSEWVGDEYAPVFKVRYREVFL